MRESREVEADDGGMEVRPKGERGERWKQTMEGWRFM